MPALLTRMSRRPYCDAISEIARQEASASATSKGRAATLSALFSQSADRFVEPRPRTRVESHCRASRRQGFRHCEAKSARGAGDERHPVRQGKGILHRRDLRADLPPLPSLRPKRRFRGPGDGFRLQIMDSRGETGIWILGRGGTRGNSIVGAKRDGWSEALEIVQVAEGEAASVRNKNLRVLDSSRGRTRSQHPRAPATRPRRYPRAMAGFRTLALGAPRIFGAR